ncbi:MAG TPA: glycosyltransferase [Gemmatimonadales bacterium]|jgi:cellulose synthase/poly-beta-1,6-N-acetylglucosamine synthase-like glycosyltransferase|nr:glycosyltransferase [Gemmatimonadales bacterium]
MLLPRLLFALAIVLCLYAYVGYPAILKLLTVLRPAPGPRAKPLRWASPLPRISIALPVYNEADVIAVTLERILAVDYPADRRQILVVSDASTDRTDEIVSRFADRGVELLRLARRQGKTAAENAARRYLTGEIVINTDASVRIHPAAVKHLIAAFDDPSVGVASARDVSVTNLEQRANSGEGTYVGYEMWIRDMETAVGGIVGASGCLYAIRAELHLHPVPEGLSRDFAAALTAREHGWRAVSVPEALCYVPRGTSLHQEYRRKVRTITRGLATLAHKRALLNPLRYGAFAWMLVSHKVCRWLVPWALVALLAALTALAVTSGWARALLAGVGAVGAVAAIAWVWPERRPLPRLLALPAYVAAGNVAVLQAWLRVFAGRPAPVWEPTRRGTPPLPSS